MSDNPLAARRGPPPAPEEMMRHARLWQHVNTLPPDSLPAKIAQLDHVLPILGMLASNPKVTGKDVIKAASNVAADGKIKPDEAVKFISQMPADPEKISPWLRQLFAANLSAVVHMKAAMMGPPQGAPQVMAPAAGPRGAPMPAAAPNPLGAPPNG